MFVASNEEQLNLLPDIKVVTTSLDELCYATQMKLRASSNPSGSKVLKEISQSREQAKKYIKALKDNEEKKTTI